ncbi:MAG: polysaccharide export protein [Candidatus Thiosymbion ectosymbiont of Robbea hypermnestra]|nr:polysaccharide export protein [Candidatus Thiosymbion ectosymbiont of Robbea hypermnestra]
MNRLVTLLAALALISGLAACKTLDNQAASGVQPLPAVPTAGGVAAGAGKAGRAGRKKPASPAPPVPTASRANTPGAGKGNSFIGEESSPPASRAGVAGAGAAGKPIPAIIGIPGDPGPAHAYRIGPHDRLMVKVFQVEELTTDGRVNAAGSFVMPLIGKVKISGLTPSEAEQLIANRLGERYLNNPQVSILISESAGHKVTVTGHVKSPGVFPMVGRTTLMQAIAMAGGLDEVAKQEEVLVFRRQEQGDVNAYVVDLASIQKGELTDPVIVSDDRVVVPKSGAAVLSRTAGHVLTSWVLRLPFPF